MNPNSAYRPDIDGLRAVAVLAVVLHHLSALLVPGGYVGVDVFFVISGYLITRIISREMEEGTFTFARFYERRARRIFPALFAMLAVTLAVGYFLLLPSDYSATLRGVLGTLFFSSNVIFWREMAEGYFAATDTGLNPLLHTWSLAVEEQFYVFFPFLLLLCFRFFRRHIVLVLIGCAVVSLAGAALLVQNKSVAVFFLSPFRAWELLAGSLLAFNTVPAIKSRPVREVVAGTGLLAIVAACFFYDSKTTFPGLAAMAPVLGAAAIMHAGASGPSMTGRLLQWRPVVYIGLISYSLYLWHWPLIALTRYAIGMVPLSPFVPALLASALLLGSLSYHFIEQPFRRSIHIPRRTLIASMATVASVFCLVSVIGISLKGFDNRFSPAILSFDHARTPLVPYKECDERSSADWCSLGAKSAVPTVLVWGDSHAMSWAPAIETSLSSLDASALLVTNSGCLPFVEARHFLKANCGARNEMVKHYLKANPGIRVVVMSAVWPLYFRDSGPLRATADSPSAKASDIAANTLQSTVQWMRENGKTLILIGPVPIYEASVPLVLAIEKITGRDLMQQKNIKAQHEMNSAFYKTVAQFKDNPSFIFWDPIDWMCARGECVVEIEGVSLYRDHHHLSVYGAMKFEELISINLQSALKNQSDHLDKNLFADGKITQ